VEPDADVRVTETDPSHRFELAAGAVRADVAKLAPGRRFVVRTADAEIEVHGTSFRVALVPPVQTCGRGIATRVAVTEGVVVVRSSLGEDRLTAGDAWPRDCSAPISVGPTSAPAATAGVTVANPLRAASSVTPPSSTAALTPSEIAAQNRLFAEATAARRRGDAQVAIAEYEQFLARYPTSQLAESATVERMRLLAGLDRARAREAASAYLRLYPKGFARREASELVAESP
jgi:hypothetical protein